MEERKFTSIEIAILLNALNGNDEADNRLKRDHRANYVSARMALAKDGYITFKPIGILDNRPVLTAKGNILVNHKP